MQDVNEKRYNQTRKRASTPRSKTGCITCKLVALLGASSGSVAANDFKLRIRRLKCGEERPSCYRCVKSGWQCDGYEHVSSLPASTIVPLPSILPRTPPLSPCPPPSLYTPTIAQNLDDLEQYYFQSFIDEVSVQLQGHDAFFWRGLALQESVETFSVRHGLVAIGALAKSTGKTVCGNYQLDTTQGTHREFALQQYQKAIRGLRESIPCLEEEKGVRTTLVSCLVLAFFDNFIGNGGFALQHIRYAREVLLNSNMLLPATITLEDQEKDKLVSMFLRLDMQALCAMGLDAHRTCIPLQPHSSTSTLPGRLSSLDEARNLRDHSVWEGYSFLYYTTKYQFLPHDQIPSAIIRLRDHLIQQLHDLNALLASLLTDIEPDSICHPLSRPESLRLYSTVLLVRLVPSLGGPETACDPLLPHFQFLLDTAREILKYEAQGDLGITGKLSTLR